MTAPKPRSSWWNRPAPKPKCFAKFGDNEVVAVFRERHRFNPGEKIRLKPDQNVVHLFDEATGKRLTA